MKPRQTIKLYSTDNFKVQILPNYNCSRPICDYCQRRCGDKIYFKRHEKIYCSMGEL